MAEIKGILLSVTRLRSWLPMILIINTALLFHQLEAREASPQQRKIEILSFGKMGKNDLVDPDLIIFTGNVRIRHNEAILSCDSAYHYDKKNQVSAYGNVHIEQGDTLNLYGDYIFYDGNLEKAFVKGNVRLVDKETTLLTDVINYNVNDRIAFYDSMGRIFNGDDELVSEKGVYYSNDRLFHFSRSITITGPDYIITADTMNYNTETEVVFFTGPTNIDGDSIRIFAHRGWYDTRNKTSRIWDNALVDNFSQIIEGDTLYYEEVRGFGEATGRICITDTANNSRVTGNHALYTKEPESFIVTDSALYIMEGDRDTLYMHADTLWAVTVTWKADTSINYRLVRAYYGARIFSFDFQSSADSLSYSFRDSTIRLYGNPVIWSEENQLTADSMLLFTVNSKMDRMELYNGAFVISQVDSLRFNQIKGRSLTGYFEENKLRKVVVEGNGESIYFLIEGDELVGVNYSKSSTIEILVDEGRIQEVTEYGEPDGVLDPPLAKIPEDMILPGFRWLIKLRPVNKNDLFRKNGEGPLQASLSLNTHLH
jgi:lipopolysaccharide export system protein LptA